MLKFMHSITMIKPLMGLMSCPNGSLVFQINLHCRHHCTNLRGSLESLVRVKVVTAIEHSFPEVGDVQPAASLTGVVVLLEFGYQEKFGTIRTLHTIHFSTGLMVAINEPNPFATTSTSTTWLTVEMVAINEPSPFATTSTSTTWLTVIMVAIYDIGA
jgi:hypothetical protein